LVELIDREQVFADNTRTVRALQTTGLELQFGRGRVFDQPYAPDLNVQLAPYRSPATVGANNIPARNRVTAFRATALDASVRCFAFETINDPSLPVLYALENYRAYICEGRPTEQRRADYAVCSSVAELDVPVTSVGFGPSLTPVPDYADALTVDVPAGPALTGAPLAVAWLDVFGTRVPPSSALVGQAPLVVSGMPLTVPWWASAMHLVSLDGSTVGNVVNVTWSLLL
jgi:hypothetical protein